MAECIHHLDLCPNCTGLRVIQMDRLEGVSSVSLDGRLLGSGDEVKVYIGPVPEPCPNQVEQRDPEERPCDIGRGLTIGRPCATYPDCTCGN